MTDVKQERRNGWQRGDAAARSERTNRTGPTAYDVAEHYDDRYFDDLAQRYTTRNRFARQRIANVFALLPPLGGARLLDLGCGMGTFTLEAARHGADAIGIDPAEAALAAAQRVAAAEGAQHARFVRADAALLPIADGVADVVLAADLAEHLDDDTFGRVLAEASRVLKPNGILVIYTPNRSHLFERLRDAGVMKQDPSHIAVRTARELAARVADAGLQTDRLVAQPSHLPVLSWFERGLARAVPLLRRRIGLVARKAG